MSTHTCHHSYVVYSRLVLLSFLYLGKKIVGARKHVISPLISVFLRTFHVKVKFSHSVMSDSLWPHRLQHTRLPCPSPSPGVCSNSCPLSRWCHPNISSSVIPFSSCPQSFPAPGSFPVSQFFASGGQSIGVSASASVLPMNIQDWFPLGLTGWIFLQSMSLLQHHSSKASVLQYSAFLIIQLSYP